MKKLDFVGIGLEFVGVYEASTSHSPQKNNPTTLSNISTLKSILNSILNPIFSPFILTNRENTDTIKHFQFFD
jgi:hypothetical protein